MRRPIFPQLLLMLICAAVGFLLVTQLRTQDERNQDVRNMTPDELIQLINTTAEDINETRDEIGQLQYDIATFERDQALGMSNIDKLRNELQRFQALSGTTPVQGAGVIITVHYDLPLEHLYALLNEVRNAGAEAIAINGQRVQARTHLQRDETNLLIDGVAVEAPLKLEVIGDQKTLEGALTRIGGLLRVWRDVAGVMTEVTAAEHIAMPAINQPTTFRYAVPAP